MPAEKITVAECNQARISVFVDANVILKAKQGVAPFFENFTRIDRPLRLCASTTLYEVAFARKTGHADTTLRDNQKWIMDRAAWIQFTEAVGRRFDRFIGPASRLVRGKIDLGDTLLASFALAIGRGKEFAIATNDEDFLELPVRVVSEFLSP